MMMMIKYRRCCSPCFLSSSSSNQHLATATVTTNLTLQLRRVSLHRIIIPRQRQPPQQYSNGSCSTRCIASTTGSSSTTATATTTTITLDTTDIPVTTSNTTTTTTTTNDKNDNYNDTTTNVTMMKEMMTSTVTLLFQRIGIGLGQWNTAVNHQKHSPPSPASSSPPPPQLKSQQAPPVMMNDDDDNHHHDSDHYFDTTSSSTRSEPSSSSSSSSSSYQSSPDQQMQQLLYQRIIETLLFPDHIFDNHTTGIHNNNNNDNKTNTNIDTTTTTTTTNTNSSSGGCNTIEIGFHNQHDVAFVQAYRTIRKERKEFLHQSPLGDTTTTTTNKTMCDHNNNTNDSTKEQQQQQQQQRKINVLWRIGYREVPSIILPSPIDRGEYNNNNDNDENENDDEEEDSYNKNKQVERDIHNLNENLLDPNEAPDTSLSFLVQDPIYQQQQQQQVEREQQRMKQQRFKKHIDDVIVPPDPTTIRKSATPSTAIVQPPQLIHNISSDYIHHVLLGSSNHMLPYHTSSTSSSSGGISTSSSGSTGPDESMISYEELAPLLQLKYDYPDDIHLIIMIHNPETQYSRYYIGQQNCHPLIIQKYRSVHEYIESMLYQTMTTLESLCGSNNNTKSKKKYIDGYGIVSNGLSLHEKHPLHVSYRAICSAAQRVYNDTTTNNNNSSTNEPSSPSFYAIQLPANALEVRGISTAKQIQQLKQSDIIQCRKHYNNNNHQRLGSYLSNLHVIAIRPLKCYSDGGTGSFIDDTDETLQQYRRRTKDRKKNGDDNNNNSNGLVESLLTQSRHFPFTLVDYNITQKINREMVDLYTNELVSPTTLIPHPPVAYNAAYQRALQLFDGHEIFERQAERRYAARNARKKHKKPLDQFIDKVADDEHGDLGNDYLNDEERETLFGCHILYQMIQDCHIVLQQARCIQIHEMLLSQYVVPMISNQFASLDEETSYVLQSYFTVYGPTMQYYVAYNTRQLLLYGEPQQQQQQSVQTKTTGPLPPPPPPIKHVTTSFNNNTTANKNNNRSSTDITSSSNNNNNNSYNNDNITKPPRYDHVLPQTKRLQEFGLELLLQQKICKRDDTITTNDATNRITEEVLVHTEQPNTVPSVTSDSESSTDSSSIYDSDDDMVNVFDTIMVGLATMDEVHDTMQIVQTYQHKNDNK